MSLVDIAEAMGTAKRLLDTNEVSVTGATLFIHEETTAEQRELLSEKLSAELWALEDGRTKVNL